MGEEMVPLPDTSKFLEKTQNRIDLLASEDTDIKHVSLYSGRAEITRTGTATLKEGENAIIIEGLPTLMVDESLRIEGHGPCIIHEVSISQTPAKSGADGASTSPTLKTLLERKVRLEKSIQRVQKCINATNTYSDTVNARFIAPADIAATQKGVEDVASQLDESLIELEAKLEEVEKEIKEEKGKSPEEKGVQVITGKSKRKKRPMAVAPDSPETVESKLGKRVYISVQAETDCEVELVLIYGITEATWDATYDVYVTMDTKEKPVSLAYKASITQNTGESWEDVSLTLETVTPTFGLASPELEPWRLSVFRLPVYRSARKAKGISIGGSFKAKERESVLDRGRRMPDFDEFEEFDSLSRAMNRRTLNVTSKGDINATFAVPGFISVPTDGTAHNVTICELDLDAEMSWVVVPKMSTKVYLTAKIKNDSEYTLLKGSSSVYVDGSFISRSDVPDVSPSESFDCPLGIDPSIRVTYEPRSKKTSRVGSALGFGLSQASKRAFEQRITIHNAKPSSAGSLKLLRVRDQVPVSEDEKIEVKLREPALTVQTKEKEKGGKKEGVAVESVVVKTNEKGCKVTAQWDGGDDSGEVSDSEETHLGKDGKIVWVCQEIPAQSKIVLSLSWDIICPYGTTVAGLDDE
ncbi:hypothetical protein CPB83DRAFT_889802 [Crepidotus variabilis]|uniref:Protein F37C4.5 n=1 Tax=Crepidotus variabilis TaxID=179855 RepID=A0A9P6ESH1_9AGAR|nr:hypothetical protein CPB83DRAFT_889802 [Crepidotus variabilis]